MDRFDRGEDTQQRRNRIIGEVRIGDMALRARNFDPDIDRAAPPDLDRIAEPRRGGRLADKADVGDELTRLHPIDQRYGAVSGGAFLVAGDDQREATFVRRHARGGGDEGGDAPLHVHRATPVEQIAPHLRHERIGCPAFTGRDHVEVSGKGEVRPVFARAARGEKVFDRTVGGLSGHEALDRKPLRDQRGLEHREDLAGGGRDTGRGDQGLGERKGVGHNPVPMPKLNLDAIPQSNATGYPPPFDAPVQERWWRRLASAAGLTTFGASHVVLKPGAWSSQRHWHDGEDEMVIMIAGEAVLIENDGETILRAGDVAAWAKGATNGHHLVNRSDADVVFVAISGGEKAGGGYSDIDMLFTADGRYVTKAGEDYGARRV